MPVDLSGFLELLDAQEVPDDADFPYDEADRAGALRRGNLLRYLTLIDEVRPTVMLVGEAPGYRGLAVTGVPFMSCREISASPGLITRDPLGDGFAIPVDPVAEWEASSAAVWRAMALWRGPLPLFWSIYPNHPYRRGEPRTNRAPRPAEVRSGTPIALELARAFGIGSFLAVGRKSQEALARAGLDAVPIRHPSQGGSRIFASQLAAFNRAA